MPAENENPKGAIIFLCPYCQRQKSIGKPGSFLCSCGNKYDVPKDGKVSRPPDQN